MATPHIVNYFWLFLHIVKKIHNLFGSLLHNTHQISFLESTVNNDLRYSLPELFIFLAGFRKVGDV
jgi:hypothetical protein